MPKNFNSQMLPAQSLGMDEIPVEYIVTSPAASIPLKIPQPEAGRVSAAPSKAKDVKELEFDAFPKLEGFV